MAKAWRSPAFSPTHAYAGAAGLYLLFSAIAFFAVRPTTLVYFADYWEHRAIIGEIARHGVQPLDPIYGENAPSRQFTPWSLSLGYLARLGHLSVDSAMAWGAMIVSVLFVLGVHRFARAFYAHRWGAVVLFITLTCCWGIPPLIWTGFHSFRSQLHSNYYPASLVFALTFLAWASTLRLLRVKGVGIFHAITLWSVIACCVITHPLNAAFLIAGAVGLVIIEPDVPLVRRVAVAVAMAASIASTVAWPYFNPLSLVSAGFARGQATFNNFEFFYDPMFVIGEAGPALFALLAVPGLVRQRAAWMPLIGLAGTFAAYVVGGLADISVSHRLLAYVILMLQLLLTKAVLAKIDGTPLRAMDRLTPRTWTGLSWIAALLVLCQIALAGQQLLQPWALAGYRYKLYDVDGDTTRVAATLPADARVLGWDSAALALPSHGVLVAAFPRPMPLSPTDAARQEDYRRFFLYRTPTCERLALARRLHATHIAFLTIEIRGLKAHKLAALGAPISPVAPWRIIAVPSPEAIGCESGLSGSQL